MSDDASFGLSALLDAADQARQDTGPKSCRAIDVFGCSTADERSRRPFLDDTTWVTC